MKTIVSAGYSLIEVVVAIFVLAGIVLSAFSIFETSSRLALKVDHEMVASRLAQHVMEELHSMYNANVVFISNTHFLPPFDQYLYSVKPEGNYLDEQNLQKISITVEGPMNSSGNTSIRAADVNYCMLLARQAYSP